jgi:hypothetical protein
MSLIIFGEKKKKIAQGRIAANEFVTWDQMSIALRRRRSAGGVNAFETAHSSSGRLFPVGITAATTTCDKFI